MITFCRLPHFGCPERWKRSLSLYNGGLSPQNGKPKEKPHLPLVAVIGPTGSGKSELAIRLAEEFHGEIVNCDSLQIYRHFDIGTAKVPESERREIPHHLLDIIEPDQVFTAGEYARIGRQTLADISSRNHIPVVAGGTGFYLRALIDGLFAGPTRDEELRRRLARREQRRAGSLHRLLRRFDRAAAERIHANDLPKLTRALEVCLLTRRPLTRLYAEGRDSLQGYRVLKLGIQPDREELYRRLDARCECMFRTGLVQEVERILSSGYAPECKPFESHGYKQVLQMLRGELTLKEAIFYAQRNTRRYAKRQMTWFRQERDVQWLRGFGADLELQDAALGLTGSFLTTVY
jgi:tRNA dimethylallyltransferase